MSYLIDSHRTNALAARLEAEQATLPNVRRRAIDSAEVWDRLAERLALVETRNRERDAAIVHGS